MIAGKELNVRSASFFTLEAIAPKPGMANHDNAIQFHILDLSRRTKAE